MPLKKIDQFYLNTMADFCESTDLRLDQLYYTSIWNFGINLAKDCLCPIQYLFTSTRNAQEC